MYRQVKTQVLVSQCVSATLLTTNRTWTALWSNPGLRGEIDRHDLHIRRSYLRCKEG